ncbi:MAG: ankyrin repeat domain-containing protein [Acidobacteriota bacterium]|nr:MAG: ankyrin repeat domain-containing protein [Acidobacteriota bacterium]
MNLHEFLDWSYEGDEVLSRELLAGADPNGRDGPLLETPLHVATRRRRLSAVKILLDHGADIDARTVGGQTAYAHAIRRKFDEVAAFLQAKGADTSLTDADKLAVAIVNGRYDEAEAILASHSGAARTGIPEEDRLLADVAGREDRRGVEMLISAGADLTATGLDAGTPLHQAAWFGQPQNARLLIDAGAPLEVFDSCHMSSPLGWAVHGSRYSGDADKRQDAYVELVRMLLEAGSGLHYPDGRDGYLQRLIEDATPAVRQVFAERGLA